MSESSFPWAQVDSDRLVTSDAMARFYAALYAESTVSGGVVVSGLEVTKLGGSQVSVAPGVAVVQGRVYINDVAKTLTPAVGLVKHRIVLRLDVPARTCEAVVATGDASGFPALTQNDTTWELGIGTVDNSAGSFTVADTRASTAVAGLAASGLVHDHSGQTLSPVSVNIDAGQVYKIGGVNLLRISGGIPQIYVGGVWANISHA